MINYKKYLVYCLILIKFSNSQHYDSQPTVNIAQGNIVGIKVYPDVSRIAVNAFLGIPYAEAPVGRLRFSIPEKHRGWNGTLYASNYGPVCPFRSTSLTSNENEDCLYLNVWTVDNGYNSQLPVIIFLESEVVISQSSLIRIPGHDLAMEGVVVVSITYRQNIFGFFCLGHPEARGNLGLLDQYLALIWVKENISKFGGNPQFVTLMGHSSSTISIFHHMISPRVVGLFNRAILMSGNTIEPKQKDIISISSNVTHDLGCFMPSIQKSMDCLRKKSVQEILHYFDRYTENTLQSSVMPIIDTFLPEKERYLPFDLQTVLYSGNYSLISILTGITDFFSASDQWKWSELNHDYSQLMQYAEEIVIPHILQQYNFVGTNKDIIKDIIRWKYLQQTEEDINILIERIHKLQWDAQVAATHERQLALLMNNVAPVYTYCLHQFSTLANVSAMSTLTGDVLLLFGPALLQQIARRRFNIGESDLSKRIKQIWINFSKYGNPTPNAYRDNWHPYRQSNKYIQYFGNRKWNRDEYENSINLWNYLLPKIVITKNTVNTIPKELQFSPDPAAGFRHAMYTLVGLVIALLTLLLVCVVLLKKRAKERTRHMGF